MLLKALFFAALLACGGVVLSGCSKAKITKPDEPTAPKPTVLKKPWEVLVKDIFKIQELQGSVASRTASRNVFVYASGLHNIFAFTDSESLKALESLQWGDVGDSQFCGESYGPHRMHSFIDENNYMMMCNNQWGTVNHSTHKIERVAGVLTYTVMVFALDRRGEQVSTYHVNADGSEVVTVKQVSQCPPYQDPIPLDFHVRFEKDPNSQHWKEEEEIEPGAFPSKTPIYEVPVPEGRCR